MIKSPCTLLGCMTGYLDMAVRIMGWLDMDNIRTWVDKVDLALLFDLKFGWRSVAGTTFIWR
jgi:hypothetical protein